MSFIYMNYAPDAIDISKLLMLSLSFSVILLLPTEAYRQTCS